MSGDYTKNTQGLRCYAATKKSCMYEKQCAMHTLYDCFVNECDPA